MRNRRDAEQERCCTGGIEKGWMHDRWDEGLDRCMKLGMQERRDAEQERFWAGGIGKVGYRTGGMQNKKDAIHERLERWDAGQVG